MEEQLVPAFRDTLCSSDNYGLIAEYAEVGLDAVFDIPVLKDIPIVNTVTAICKTGYHLHERNLLKQTFSFISEFNTNSISQERLEEYRYELENDPRKAERELGRVIIILGNHIDDVQSRILGSFYAAYVKGAISWEKFCELSEANRRMFVSDYTILYQAVHENGLNLQGRELYQVDRLISLGLLQNHNRLGGSVWIEIKNDGSGEPKQEKDIIVTSFGKTFCQHMQHEHRP